MTTENIMINDNHSNLPNSVNMKQSNMCTNQDTSSDNVSSVSQAPVPSCVPSPSLPNAEDDESIPGSLEQSPRRIRTKKEVFDVTAVPKNENKTKAIMGETSASLSCQANEEYKPGINKHHMTPEECTPATTLPTESNNLAHKFSSFALHTQDVYAPPLLDVQKSTLAPPSRQEHNQCENDERDPAAVDPTASHKTASKRSIPSECPKCTTDAGTCDTKRNKIDAVALVDVPKPKGYDDADDEFIPGSPKKSIVDKITNESSPGNDNGITSSNPGVKDNIRDNEDLKALWKDNDDNVMTLSPKRSPMSEMDAHGLSSQYQENRSDEPSMENRNNYDEYVPSAVGPATLATCPTVKKSTKKRPNKKSKIATDTSAVNTKNTLDESANFKSRETLARKAKTNKSMSETFTNPYKLQDPRWLSKPSLPAAKRKAKPKKPIAKITSRKLRSAVVVQSNGNKVPEIEMKKRAAETERMDNEAYAQRMANIKAFNKFNRPQQLPDIELLNLKSVTAAELQINFNEICPKFLLPHFEAYCQQTEYKPTRTTNLPMYVMNYLLNGSQQLVMMAILQENFTSPNVDYDDLFWEVLMPEWSLTMFMNKFGFDRQAAIDRIDLQVKKSEECFEIDD